MAKTRIRATARTEGVQAMRTLRLLKRWSAAIVCGAALSWAAGASAASLSLVPSVTGPQVGSLFAVDLVVSGLGVGVAPSLGAFDVTITFDPAVLSFDSASFGALLGPVTIGSNADVIAGAGSVNVAEFAQGSVSAADLNALQNVASFSIASLSFTPLDVATTAIAISSASLGNAAGFPLAVSLPLASIEVTTTPGSAVPEPGAFLLYAMGMLVVGHSLGARRAG
jgi:hypothetical protein